MDLMGLQTTVTEAHKWFRGEPGSAASFPLTVWVSFEAKGRIMGF